MNKTAAIKTADLVTAATSHRLAVWNRRLLIGATVLILCGASMLALHAAGPHAQAMVAGEGMLINWQE